MWSDANRAGMGYIVLRSTDGVKFSTLTTLAGGSAKKYTDSAVSAGQAYYYEVEATGGGVTSGASNAASVAIPKPAPAPTPAPTVTITTRYTNELVVTAFGAADSIVVSESGGLLTIQADGQTYTNISLPGSLFIYDRGGADTITIASSVGVRTTVTAMGAGTTTVNSSITNLSAWLDSTDKFSGTGTVHMIGTLAGGVSKAQGAALANPSDSGTTMKVSESLWGSGPSATDINQGGVGDCYFLASLAAFAGTKPQVVQESAVDMGDGTYLVQFMKNNAPVYVRVSNDLPTGPYYGYGFARPGADQTMWVPIMEKAFTYFRTGASTYASTNSGWMSEVYSDTWASSYTNFSIVGSESSSHSMVSVTWPRAEARSRSARTPRCPTWWAGTRTRWCRRQWTRRASRSTRCATRGACRGRLDGEQRRVRDVDVRPDASELHGRDAGGVEPGVGEGPGLARGRARVGGG